MKNIIIFTKLTTFHNTVLEIDLKEIVWTKTKTLKQFYIFRRFENEVKCYYL